MIFWVQLLKALPEIIKFLKHIQSERELRDDVKRIDQAFKNKDADALRDIFNNSVSDPEIELQI